MKVVNPSIVMTWKGSGEGIIIMKEERVELPQPCLQGRWWGLELAVLLEGVGFAESQGIPVQAVVRSTWLVVPDDNALVLGLKPIMIRLKGSIKCSLIHIPFLKPLLIISSNVSFLLINISLIKPTLLNYDLSHTWPATQQRWGEYFY